MKSCTKCKQEKTLSDFRSNPTARDGLRAVCRSCDAAAARKHYHENREESIARTVAWRKGKQAHINASARVWRSSPTGSVSELLGQAKKRALAGGLPFKLTPADAEIPDTCPVFGQPLRRKSGKGPSAWSPSLDKIIPANGYVPGNVMVMSHKANVMKNDATPEELLMFADWVYKTFGLLRKQDP